MTGASMSLYVEDMAPGGLCAAASSDMLLHRATGIILGSDDCGISATEVFVTVDVLQQNIWQDGCEGILYCL